MIDDIKLVCDQIKRQLEYKLRMYVDEVTVSEDCGAGYCYLDITDHELLRNMGGDKAYNLMLGTHVIGIDKDNIDLKRPICHKKVMHPYQDNDKPIMKITYDKDCNMCDITEVHVHDTDTPSTHLHMVCDKINVREIVDQVMEGIKINRNLSGLERIED